METTHPRIKLLVLSLSLLALSFQTHAAQEPTCGDLGMWTWNFASGVLGGADPGEACEEAWNDYASGIADSPGYSISYGTSLVSVDPPICVGVYYCKACRGYVANPVEVAPAPIPPGQAGHTAERIAPGEIFKIERHDDFEGMQVAYTVDILGPEGKVQVIVDGMTGEAALVKPDDQGNSSCQDPNNP